MSLFTTNAQPGLLERFARRLRVMMSNAKTRSTPSKLDGQKILDAQARRVEARARVDRLLR